MALAHFSCEILNLLISIVQFCFITFFLGSFNTVDSALTPSNQLSFANYGLELWSWMKQGQWGGSDGSNGYHGGLSSSPGSALFPKMSKCRPKLLDISFCHDNSVQILLVARRLHLCQHRRSGHLPPIGLLPLPQQLEREDFWHSLVLARPPSCRLQFENSGPNSLWNSPEIFVQTEANPRIQVS